jgi:tRNA (mo5U34)-methyltransferase
MAWTKEEVERLVEEEDGCEQRIALPFGLATRGRDRSKAAERALAAALFGRSVLDVCCGDGFFSFEALRRGAARVVALDPEPDRVRRARRIADCLGLAPEIGLLDPACPLEGGFDFVLCWNALAHARDPLALLEKLAAATRGRLVLEFLDLARAERRRLGISAFCGFALAREPVIFVGKGGVVAPRGAERFAFSRAAIERLLLGHRGDFSGVEFAPSDIEGRTIAIATRRRIGRLLLVAGPTAAGKTTMIERLKKGALPEVAERLELGDARAWPTIPAGKLREIAEPAIDRLIFHYDFLRPYLRRGASLVRDEALDPLEVAERVQAVTIFTPPERLLRQYEQSEIEPRLAARKDVPAGERRARLWREYRDPAAIARLYRAWFEFCRGRIREHWVVTLDPQTRIEPAEAFEARLAGDAPR